MDERNTPISIRISEVDSMSVISTLLAAKGFAMKNLGSERSRDDAKNNFDLMIDLFEEKGGQFKIDLADGFEVSITVNRIDDKKYDVIIVVPRAYYDFFCGGISFYR